MFQTNRNLLLNTGKKNDSLLGVYWNQSLGLISLVSRSGNGITMSDKNLGATQTYEVGDVLSESNCGKYYQRGNNYGFPYRETGSGQYYSDSLLTKIKLTPYNSKYYSSSTFIIGNDSWIDTKHPSVGDLWGGDTGTNEAMQGPCPTGFHISSNSEWQELYDILITDFGLANNGDTLRTYLKMPFAGQRDINNNVIDQSISGSYWASTVQTPPTQFGSRFVWTSPLEFNSTGLSFGYRSPCARGYSIRPFKNTPVVPDSSWTTLYDGSTIATGAGIFQSPSNKPYNCISISADGQNRITIANRNLGATQVYNDGDVLSEANCGYYYQRGNNYGFPRDGSATITTSSTLVNTFGYGAIHTIHGPGKYYNSNIYIIENPNWLNPHNTNLRGGETGTNEAMQGPCPTGFHIPSNNENVALVDAMTTLGINTSTGNCMKTYLKMPYAGYRGFVSSSVKSRSDGVYLSANVSDNGGVYALYFLDYGFSPQYPAYPANAYSIRPFKNTPVVPDSSWTTLYDGSSVAAGAGIFHNTIEGLISISTDGINRITIVDKNLGATQVYNDGDTLSESNCGKYYQRGNNYGFPWDSSATITTSSTQVDTAGYGPDNYYSNDKYFLVDVSGSSPSGITIPHLSWSLFTWTSDTNLWGGDTGTNEARRGPCSEGFHVPSYDELTYLKDLLDSAGITYNNLNSILKAPFTGWRKYSYLAQVLASGEGAIWLSSDAGNIGHDFDTPNRLVDSENCDTRYVCAMKWNVGGSSEGTIIATKDHINCCGCMIRPFYNTFVEPDETWTVLYQPSS